MHKIARMSIFAAALAGLSFGADFSGNLIDSACYSKQKDAGQCAATATTTSFGLDVAGKVYTLDSAGNSKAATALKSRADRVDPNKASTAGPISAKVSGTASGNSIMVDSIEVQ